jgi:UDP-GlcNAc:undecaprenyl-phosphate GlcNAc-1-phosphate transferase
MDMLAIVVRRYKNGKSPFKPDRDHLHHILQRAGLSSGQTLIAISTVAAFMSIIGLVGEYFKVSDSVMLIAFMILFFGYIASIKRIQN